MSTKESEVREHLEESRDKLRKSQKFEFFGVDDSMVHQTEDSIKLYEKTGILKGLDIKDPHIYSNHLARKHRKDHKIIDPFFALKMQYFSDAMKIRHQKEKLIAQELQKELRPNRSSYEKDSDLHIQLRNKTFNFWKLIYAFAKEQGIENIPGRDVKISSDFEQFITDVYSDEVVFNPKYQGAILAADVYSAFQDCDNERVIQFLANDTEHYFDLFLFGHEDKEGYDNFKRAKAFVEYVKEHDPNGETINAEKLEALVEFAEAEHIRTREFGKKKLPGISVGYKKYESHGLFCTVPPANILKKTLEGKLNLDATIKRLEDLETRLKDIMEEVKHKSPLDCKISENPKYAKLIEDIEFMFKDSRNIRNLSPMHDSLSSRQCAEYLGAIRPYLDIIIKIKEKAHDEAESSTYYTEVVPIDDYEQRLFDEKFDGDRTWISGKTAWVLNSMYGGALSKQAMITVPMVSGMSGHVDVSLIYGELFDLNKKDIFKAMVANLILCDGHSLTEVVFGSMSYSNVFPEEMKDIRKIDEDFVDTMGEIFFGKEKWQELLKRADLPYGNPIEDTVEFYTLVDEARQIIFDHASERINEWKREFIINPERFNISTTYLEKLREERKREVSELEDGTYTEKKEKFKSPRTETKKSKNDEVIQRELQEISKSAGVLSKVGMFENLTKKEKEEEKLPSTKLHK
ncbi:hypothetical protein SAMN02746069_01706 [Legionella israelensis DSM 19235]|uniref:hypothetical protein n=1 Tax=Legionella israelensis TaxID=454 RepID=UPI00088F3E75|nr:hypothetical protein [Legionella israelensis]SCY22628.1 hypothetical protein SAMN02746069_01706 [Legionella israelensis DSM 19235]